MPKSKEQKQREAVERNRRDLYQHRELYLRHSPGGDLYEELVRTKGRDEADAKARDYDRQFTRAAQAANVDRHGNPVDLGWTAYSEDIVEVHFPDSRESWQAAVVDCSEKAFVSQAGAEWFVLMYATQHEWDKARRRFRDQVEHKVVRRFGMPVE